MCSFLGWVNKPSCAKCIGYIKLLNIDSYDVNSKGGMFGRLKHKPVSSVCLGDGMTLSQVANLIVTEAVVKCNCA